MLPRTILDLLQNQYKHESANHFRYIARSSWANKRGFNNTAVYFAKEANGELKHSSIVRDYIEQRNEAVEPSGFAFDDSSIFKTFDELFTTALKVEQETTDLLNNIYQEAIAVGDFMTSTWVQQLITEQIEEENIYQTIIDRMIQRGGGGDEVTALNNFRKDQSASHDLDAWIGETFND